MAIFNIEEELKKLPSKPGVYLMHDDKDAIIYVGKAISLKNRVRQYFQSSRNKGVKIERRFYYEDFGFRRGWLYWFTYSIQILRPLFQQLGIGI